jgi:hypothetical protein
MADAIITRRGGTPFNRAKRPSINLVDKTAFTIIVNFTNNEDTEVDLFYGLDETPPTTKITLAGGATSSNVTFSGLDDNTDYTIFSYVFINDIFLKKIKSEIISTTIKTNEALYTVATGGTTFDYNSDGKRYRSHTFASNGNFVVTQAGNEERNQADYLVIGGGASGGGGRGGGGGAGGYRTSFGPTSSNVANQPTLIVQEQTYSVEIGAGGAGVGSGNGNSGDSSSAFGTTSTGGGGGGPTNSAGQAGASGGGGGALGSVGGGAGIVGEGRNGGSGTNNQAAGGGGGAGGVGGNSSGISTRGPGGVGLANLLRTGSNEIRAVGGRGANDGGGASPSGAPNTGNGGHGREGTPESGAGGSGVVIIRYEIPPTS